MRKKGTFARGLPVAKRYVWPGPRRRIVLVGLLAAMVVACFIVYGLFVERGRFLSAGAVSSSHASFETDCASCHEPLNEPSPERCGDCHERMGDELGVHTWPAHYVYHSGDFGRLGIRSGEGPCQTCHVEHRGRDAGLTRATENLCVDCHEFGSITEGHPEFEPLRQGTFEDSNLKFPHTHHVKELMEKNGWSDHEQACLACHMPGPGGDHYHRGTPCLLQYTTPFPFYEPHCLWFWS